MRRLLAFVPIHTLLVLVLAAGCTPPAADCAQDARSAFVVTARANQVLPSITPEVSAQLRASVVDCARVTVVAADGSPRVVAVVDTRITAENDLLAERQRRAFLQQLGDVISSSVAQTEEAATLEALALASRAVADGRPGQRRITVIDSGLSTAGVLALQHGALEASPSDTVSLLSAAAELPQLTGVDVLWLGLGDVAGPQGAPGTAELSALRDLWRLVVTQSGGAVEFVSAPLPAGSASARSLPRVTPIRFDRPRALGWTLTDSRVRFISNSATYAEPVRARRILSVIADQLRTVPDVPLVLTGTTATGGPGSTDAGRRRLSLARARAVANTLRELGVTNRLRVEGVGTNFPGWVRDVRGGRLVEALARRNRNVFITSSAR